MRLVEIIFGLNLTVFVLLLAANALLDYKFVPGSQEQILYLISLASHAFIDANDSFELDFTARTELVLALGLDIFLVVLLQRLRLLRD